MSGHWDRHYAGVTERQHYGDSASYRLGAEWLAECETIADWGCGLGWFYNFVPHESYVGIDGSRSVFAEIVADLATVDWVTDGVFIRHVLEHNADWEQILVNALNCTDRRLFLAIFTPWSPTDTAELLRFEDDYRVPTLALPEKHIRRHLGRFSYEAETIESPETYYGLEHIFRVEVSR